jgi:hypothetical protein
VKQRAQKDVFLSKKVTSAECSLESSEESRIEKRDSELPKEVSDKRPIASTEQPKRSEAKSSEEAFEPRKSTRLGCFLRRGSDPEVEKKALCSTASWMG